MRVVVGQGSCGVATGARKTSDELQRLIDEKGLTNVTVDLTGCVLGAVPPVAFDERLLNVADPTLFTRYEEIAFNAGARDVSIIINTEDFHRIVAPREIDFLKKEE